MIRLKIYITVLLFCLLPIFDSVGLFFLGWTLDL